MDIKNRKITRFRCYYDPMVGAKPKQAFDKSEFPHADFELTPVGVYVRINMKTGPRATDLRLEEHLIPFANIQSIKFMPLPEPEKKPDTDKVP